MQKSLTGEGIEGPRKMITGTISGPDEPGAVRRIDLVFAEDKTTLTSCGPTRSETSLQILYKTNTPCCRCATFCGGWIVSRSCR